MLFLHPPWQDFCAEVKLAEAAHHARLTVNSEEILACLLEALGSGRSEGTRAELFNAVAAMARSCAIYGPSQETSDGLPTIAEFDLGGQPARGLLATLRKGLPAIVQAVSTVLDCPVRRAFSWKERKAALDLIVALAALRDLRGPEGPLGEHRLQLIHGATTGKRDSVAAVREAAVQSLAALEATGVEKTERETLKTGMISCLGTLGDGSRGLGETGRSVDDTRNKHHQSGEAKMFTDLEKLKKKTLDGALRKWERVASDAVDAAERKIERFREHRDEGRKKQQRQRRAEEEAPVASSTLSALLEVERTPSSRDGEQQQERPTSPQKISLSEAVADECEEKDVNGNTRTPDRCKPTPLGTPGASEDGAETGKDDSDRAPPEREAGADTSRAEATTTHDAVPKRGHQECDIPPARLGGNATAEVKQECVQGAVPLQRQQPLPTAPSPAEDKAQFSVTSIVPKLDQEEPAAAAVTVAAVAAATGEGPAPMLSPSSLLPPMNEGPQADTARLLQHLCNKTDTIASVLESLGQRVVGMERTLVVSSPFALPGVRAVRLFNSNTAVNVHGRYIVWPLVERLVKRVVVVLVDETLRIIHSSSEHRQSLPLVCGPKDLVLLHSTSAHAIITTLHVRCSALQRPDMSREGHPDGRATKRAETSQQTPPLHPTHPLHPTPPLPPFRPPDSRRNPRTRLSRPPSPRPVN